MNVVFLGATKGMGRALARRMAERGDRLFLLGRREDELDKTAADLGVRGGGAAPGHAPCDLERGRKPVVLYGASKAGLTAYLEGLDHKHRADGLEVVTVKPGFVKTGMTSELDPPPFAGEPEDVAVRVLAALDRGAPVVYAPIAWGPIMAVIRSLPRFVMRRVGF